MNRTLFFIIILLFVFMQGESQTVQLLPAPDAGYGYLGSSIIYNNKLYTLYRDVNHESRLAQYDGTTVSLIPNPDANGVGFNDTGIIYNNKLYFQYGDKNGVWRLAQFDGNTVTLIPNPDNSSGGYMGSPVIFNNNLYVQYLDNSGVLQLAKFDGNALTIIPYAGAQRNEGYTGWPIVYNNNLYMQYIVNGACYLAKYDGNAISFIPNAPGGQYGVINFSGPQEPRPIIYNNKLCLYYNVNTVTHIAEFDGTSIKIIPNPDNNNFGYFGYQNSPIIYNNKLYVEYYSAAHVAVLAAYDGTALTIVPGTTTTTYGSYPIVNGCDLYYFSPNGLTTYDAVNTDYVATAYSQSMVTYNHEVYFPTATGGLGQYDGSGETTIQDPLSTHGFASNEKPIVYNNNLFIDFFTDQGIAMGYLDNSGNANSTTIPQLSITASSTHICEGQNVTFTSKIINPGLNTSYQWQVNGINVGTNAASFQSNTLKNGDIVQCTLTIIETCFTDSTKSNEVIMAVDPIITPSVTIASSGNNICSGTPVAFTADALNSGNSPAYKWQVNNNDVGSGTNTYASSTLKNGDNISCIVTSNAACPATNTALSNSITMNVLNSIQSSINIAPAANNICFGNPATFTANPTNQGNAPLFQWQINGADVDNNSASYTSNNLQNGDVLSCMLTSSIACSMPSVSNNITMVVYALPHVTDGTEKIIQAGTSTMLDLSITGNIASYSWAPADGISSADSKSPSVSPTTNTIYELTVTTADGCTATGKITVDVFTNLLMPNAFTPNGDGENDFFRIPPSVSVNLQSFTVFNRGGNMVFETNNPSTVWDGTYKGEAQPGGPYVWMINYIDPLKGVVKKLQGTVLLIR